MYPELQKLGASMVLISPQVSKYSEQIIQKHNLTYPVLSDKDNEFAKILNITFTFSEKMKELHSGGGVDLNIFNGEDSWVMPVPARLIIDTKGIIRYAEVHPDYTVRPDPIELVNLMKSIVSES